MSLVILAYIAHFPAEEDLVLSALEYIIGEKKTKQSYKNARVVV